MKPALSVLDLAPVPEGGTAAEALRRTVELARLADLLGYTRYWFAEHHGMPSVASSSPEILIGHVAAATQRIRVGSGGIMLPNHPPLRVAENFRTLAALFPGRIDLGLGRAPGSDYAATRALRAVDGVRFPALLSELLAFCGQADFGDSHPSRSVIAVPAEVPLPPVWILGSSGASAQLAGMAGMGYAFASHFSPAPAGPAFERYRESFEPTAAFPRPHAILGVAAVCAPTDAEADLLASTMDLAWLRIRRGEFLPLPSPQEARAYPYSEEERAAVREYRERTVVGNPQAVWARIREMAKDAGADEVMVVSNLHGHAERLRSYELLAEAYAA
ncbi:LLM class flavin-dependent oxidoreductase [Solimonas sp. K1W22B-7]|uniref:LLM class flavin-dependent oxidoreductase n=1 Tax=Solimonas sp. K1W22B-7 TaxID=2303331 RepID=UPI000E332805|nr:LLM class flavin-dependent oxidoreductase [Solimonas sp. K1W22B-7]AXQ27231.1 LLM class flavin-dependent oxidoreductase [Solimonas sp. K1W22B-7]